MGFGDRRASFSIRSCRCARYDRRDGEAARADDHPHGRRRAQRFLGAILRWCEGRIPSSSRYLATVRRAMVSPCACRVLAMSWSEYGLRGVLARDQVLDGLLHRHRGDHVAVVGGDAAVEEPLELVEALRRLDVLVGGHPADGGLVHPDVLAHVAEREGAAGATGPGRRSRAGTSPGWWRPSGCVRCRCSTLLMSHSAERSFCSTNCLSSPAEPRRSER